MNVENPDGKEYLLTFKNPKTNKYIASEKLKANLSAGDFLKKVKGFYWSTLRSDIKVTRFDLDEDGKEISVTNKTLKSYRYEIEVLKLIKDVSTT